MNHLEVLRELVLVNSFTHNREGVVRVGEMVADLFAPLGFDAERVRSVTETCGDHLFLRRPGDIEVVLVTHLDTVYPEHWEWRIDGDRIYGPGVADIKGGTVLMWMMLRLLPPELFERVGWTILCNASEEGGCADFPVLARARVPAGAKACLVFEPAVDDVVVVARRGAARFRAIFRGREAHSGNAHAEGASAIREMARFIETVESRTDYDRNLTFNVGVASGGTYINCVPGSASCQVDMRTRTRDVYLAERERLLAIAGDGSIEGCSVEIGEMPGYPPWEPNPDSDRLGRLLVAVAGEQGITLTTGLRNGASDGSHLCDLVPTIDGLGPAGRDFHIAGKESVDASSFEPRARLAAAFLQRLLA